MLGSTTCTVQRVKYVVNLLKASKFDFILAVVIFFIFVVMYGVVSKERRKKRKKKFNSGITQAYPG